MKMEKFLQQELSKMFSSDFSKVTNVELTPFMAVMRLIKVEYALTKPVVYKMIITILHDYNPSLGARHRQKTIRYIRILLISHPDLADFLINILPQHTSISKPKGPIVTVKHAEKRVSEVNVNAIRTAVKKVKRDQDPKCYNYTAPVVSAYVASQGIPGKITSSLTNQQPLLSFTQTALPIVSLPRLTVQPTQFVFPPRDATGNLGNLSCVPTTVTPISLKDLKNIVADRSGLDLRTLSAIKRSQDGKYKDGNSKKRKPKSSQSKTEELKNKQKNLIVATNEVKARVSAENRAQSLAAPDHHAVMKALRMATTDKFLKIKVHNPRSKLVPTALTNPEESTVMELETKESTSQPHIIVMPSRADPKVKKSSSASDVSDTNITYEIQRSSYTFPYQQQITLANGKKQNFIINRMTASSKAKGFTPIKIWNPPQHLRDSLSQSHSSLQCDQPLDFSLSPEFCDEQPVVLPVDSDPSVIDVINSERSSTSQDDSFTSVLNEDPLRKPTTQLMEPLETTSILDENKSKTPDMTSEDEHMLLLSQMDGTSDHGDFSLPGSNIQSPLISPNNSDIRDSVQMTDGCHGDIHCPESPFNAAVSAGSTQIYAPVKNESVENVGYLSRLIATPSPPNCSNPWGLIEARRPPKPKQLPRKRRKVRR